MSNVHDLSYAISLTWVKRVTEHGYTHRVGLYSLKRQEVL
jgi:hypothetical protein